MGGDSYSEDCGFESQHWTLDGHFFILIFCKYCLFEKGRKIEKEVWDGHFLLTKANLNVPLVFNITH